MNSTTGSEIAATESTPDTEMTEPLVDRQADAAEQMPLSEPIVEDSRLRTFTDATGKFKVVAELIEFKKDWVKLKKEDGKELTMPIAQLSPVDQAWIKANATKKSPEPPPPKSTASTSLVSNVEVVNVKVVSVKNEGTGTMGQEVLVTWKNTGSTPIRIVDGNIKTLNRDGSTKDSFKYTLYASFNSSAGIAPGAIYTPKRGTGFRLPGYKGMPGYIPVASAEVQVTKATEKGME